MNFTVNAGWNEQVSELTVNLVEDCTDNSPRIEYDTELEGSIVTGVDKFVKPYIGCPVYFRIGDKIVDGQFERNYQTDAEGNTLYSEGQPKEGGFEFAGLLQSWTEKINTNGNPTYSVKIVDPRIILQNSHIIVSDLAESVFVEPPDLNRGSLATPNIINAYAWLEALGVDCRSYLGDYPTLIPEGDAFGTKTGSLVGGFGAAGVNHRGMRWNVLKQALAVLLSSPTVPAVVTLPPTSVGHVLFNGTVSTDPYSPYGRLVYRGSHGNDVETPIKTGSGVLGPDPLSNEGQYARYILDITEIPFAPDHYRITGPFISISELITQVCSAAGCDYYVELLPLPDHNLVIKVRVVKRRLQPKLGEIEKYVNDQDFVVSKTFGQELANQNNSAFIFGAPRQDYAEQTNLKSGGSWLELADLNIIPHPGWNSEGNTQVVTYGDPYGGSGGSQWWWYLDFRQINRSLATPIPASFGWVSETELRFVTGNYDAYIDWNISRDASIRSVVNTWFTTLGITQGSGPIVGNALKDLLTPVAGGGGTTANASSSQARDAVTFYQWLRTFSEDYYGKKYLVKIPGVCKAYNFEQTSVGGYLPAGYYSDEPATDGGWPQVASVLGLTKPSAQLDLFSTTDGKILPLLKFYSNTHRLVTDDLNDFVADTSSNTVWVKADMEDKWLIGLPFGLWTTTEYWAQLTVNGMLTKRLSNAPVESQRAAAARNIDPTRNDLGEELSTTPLNDDKKNQLVKLTGYLTDPGVLPINAGVPLKSNTRCYGPWGNIAIAGINNDLFKPEQPVAGNLEVKHDPGLAPWFYGSAVLMNDAAQAEVKLTTTEMQVVERGQVTIPGYPNKRIGSALNTADTSSYNMALTADSIGANDSFSYYRIDLSPAEGLASNAASISSVNVNVNSQGVQTEYSLTTFTPVFGRFADDNAKRLKQVGQNALAASRARRAGQELRGALNVSSRRAARRAKELFGGRAPRTSSLWFCGKMITSGGQTRTEVVANDPDAQSYYGPDYNSTAIMTMDGLFRPVSKEGDGSLPAYAGTAPGCLKGFSVAPPPPGTVDGSKGYAEPLSIVNTGLDPLANPTGVTAGSVAGRSASPNKGHDIDGVSRGTLTQIGSYNTGVIDMRFGNLGYQNDYRFMALRGPLVVHGWGYDLQGKPVPNSAGASTSYTSMTDQFADGWLQDPSTWPVAPVDLRFDRQRGVWTTPPSFRMYKVTSSEEIAAGATGNATVQNASDAANQGDGTIGINNITCSNVPADCNYLAYYDTATCEYWPIVAGSGGGGSLGIIDEAYCTYEPDHAATGSGGACSDVSCFRLGWGLQIDEYDPTGTRLTAPWWIDERVAPNLTDMLVIDGGLVAEPIHVGEGEDRSEDECGKTLKVSLSSECGATCSESNRDYCPPTGVQGFKWGEGFITIGEEGDPVPEIHKKLEFEETTGPLQKVGDVISHVNLGCGLKLDEGDEKCETSAKISISNDEEYAGYGKWAIKVACGIKCNSEGIEVVEKKIWISNCGLVLGTSQGDSYSITYGGDVPCQTANTELARTAINTEPSP